MARLASIERTAIDETVARWRDKCLREDRSLLFGEQTVWTIENLDELHERLIEHYIGGTDQDFYEKLKVQIENAPEAVARLASDLLVVYSLFVWEGALSAAAKRELVMRPLEYTGVDLDSVDRDSAAWRALESGIGNPGGRYAMRRHDELSYLIGFARAFKGLESSRQDGLLDDPWEFESWLDALELPVAQSRHVLLHLLFPDDFERSASGGHKRRIAETYESVLEDRGDHLGVDQKLAAIRARLRESLELSDEELDFYEPPLNGWLVGDPEDEEALRHKGQLVFYGPPGTSKTYDARRLAEGLIRSEALRRWGHQRVLDERKQLEDAVKDNSHYLQLHPAYSYEEFIGGLQLVEGGGTAYVRGYLPRLADKIRDERDRFGKDALPHVLILDEMNRADLSRVLGEAFARLDRDQRGVPVELTGGDPASEQPTLVLPLDLYFIGTMNLIDQSVEQLDFALRRRFLWRESPFDADRLRLVLEEHWQQGEPALVPWERVAPDMQNLCRAAERLNARIDELDLLGPQYEVGHTYFFDVVPVLKSQLTSSRQSVFLWGRGAQRAPTPALERFWELSLKPLLTEYLAGVDETARRQHLDQLREAFLTAP